MHEPDGNTDFPLPASRFPLYHMLMPLSVREVYDRLFVMYGPQNWWPAESSFEVIVGAVLVQNTNWGNVEKAIENLKSQYLLSPEAIENLSEEELAEVIRPAGAYRIKAGRLRQICAWLHEHAGLEALERWATEDLRDSLLRVRGIGRETADAILCYAFDRPVFVVDAYALRLFDRLGLYSATESGSDYEGLHKFVQAKIGEDAPTLNEFHALIVKHSKEICKREPQCNSCGFASVCEWAQGHDQAPGFLVQ